MCSEWGNSWSRCAFATSTFKNSFLPALSLEILSGSKVVLETGDKIQIDCSVADKVSGTLSIMEIT